jgi:ribosomal protein S24E
MEIINQIENKFLNRKELLLKFPHKDAPTPSKEEVKKQVIEKFKVAEENVDLRYIFSQKNRDYSVAKVFVKEKPKEIKESSKKVKKDKNQTGKKKSEKVK